jgi:hypothetical protein
MKELNRFWVNDCDEEEEIFVRTSWMVPGFERSRSPGKVRKAPARERTPASRISRS